MYVSAQTQVNIYNVFHSTLSKIIPKEISIEIGPLNFKHHNKTLQKKLLMCIW